MQNLNIRLTVSIGDFFDNKSISVNPDLDVALLLLEGKRARLQDLFTLQNVILTQEDRVLSVDEVLTRVLEFYRRFVPYR